MPLSIGIGIGIAKSQPPATGGGEVPDGALFNDDAENEPYFTDDALTAPYVTKD
jgi:hypothetical protein